MKLFIWLHVYMLCASSPADCLSKANISTVVVTLWKCGLCSILDFILCIVNCMFVAISLRFIPRFQCTQTWLLSCLMSFHECIILLHGYLVMNSHNYDTFVFFKI